MCNVVLKHLSVNALYNTELTRIMNCDKTFLFHKGCCVSKVMHTPTAFDLFHNYLYLVKSIIFQKKTNKQTKTNKQNFKSSEHTNFGFNPSNTEFFLDLKLDFCLPS